MQTKKVIVKLIELQLDENEVELTLRCINVLLINNTSLDIELREHARTLHEKLSK